MALCLFGGAFNPPHRTHERVIRAALEQLPVDRVVVQEGLDDLVEHIP